MWKSILVEIHNYYYCITYIGSLNAMDHPIMQMMIIIIIIAVLPMKNSQPCGKI